MNKKIFSFALVCFFAVTFFSCKNENPEKNFRDYVSKIQGKVPVEEFEMDIQTLMPAEGSEEKVEELEKYVLEMLVKELNPAIIFNFKGDIRGFEENLRAFAEGMEESEILCFCNFSRVENLTEIKEKTFYNCKGLKGIVLPESLEAVGDEAFKDSGLEEIFIPKNVCHIGKDAFENVKKVKYLK